MAVATALRAALLCAAQIEAFDAATVVHNAVFINSHRHLPTKRYTGCKSNTRTTPPWWPPPHLHHGVVAAVRAEFAGGVHANLEAGVAL